MQTISNDNDTERKKGVWMRGLHMLIFLFLLNIALTVLAVVAVVQFFWLLTKGEKNHGLSDFGHSFGRWFLAVIRFQTLQSDVKPFPWAEWPGEE